MKVAAIELFVNVRATRAMRSDSEAILRALRADPGARTSAALEAIRAAADRCPDMILCPGWTFVGRRPSDRVLREASNGATLVFEVLDADPVVSKKVSAAGNGARRFPWRSFVLDGEETRELAPQVLAVASDLNDERHAKALAEALRTRRDVGDALLVVCGEVNIVRRRPREAVKHEWEPRVADAGLRADDLTGRLVLNPAHTPNGSYVRAKWRAGPWRAIVCTANTLDRSKLGRPGLAEPANAVVRGRDRKGDPEDVGVTGSRVVVFDV